MKFKMRSVNLAAGLLGFIAFSANAQDTDTYIECHGGSEVSGEFIGTAGTRGTWVWHYYLEDYDKWYGGGRINICGYNHQITSQAGNTYYGEWTGTEFNGQWYNFSQRCPWGNHSYACDPKQVPVTDRDEPTAEVVCWGNLSFKIKDGDPGGQEAEGWYDHCGGVTRNGYDGGPRPVHATQEERW